METMEDTNEPCDTCAHARTEPLDECECRFHGPECEGCEAGDVPLAEWVAGIMLCAPCLRSGTEETEEGETTTAGR